MKICVQSGELVYDIGYEKGYEMIRNAGFDSVDWNIDVMWSLSKVLNGDPKGGSVLAGSYEEAFAGVQEELSYIRKNGLEVYQAHAPFPAYIPDMPELLDLMIPIYINCIKVCNDAGCQCLIIHGISKEDCGNDAERCRELNLKLYSALIPTLKETNVIVCLENLFTTRTLYGKVREGICADPNEAVWYIDTLNEMAGKECFGLCLDTGHLNLIGKKISSYAKVLGKRIKAFHTHDNDGISDLHLAPFTGTIDWQDFCEALKEIGYDRDLSFETFNQISLRRMPVETIPAWLKMICETGKVFREKIQG